MSESTVLYEFLVRFNTDKTVRGAHVGYLRRVVDDATGEVLSETESGAMPVGDAAHAVALQTAIGELAASLAASEEVERNRRAQAEADRAAAVQAQQQAEAARDAALASASAQSAARATAEAIADAAVAARIAAEGAAAEQRGRADALQAQLDAMAVQAPDFVPQGVFMDRWATEDLARFYAAKKSDPILEAFDSLVTRIGGVRLTSQRAADGRAYLIAAGIISEAEAEAIFAPVAQ